MIETAKTARVLFDEGHSEAWTIDPERAAAMQPSHPGDSSMAHAAALLRRRDFEVEPTASGALAEQLAGASVLVIAHPSDSKWEATTGEGEPRFSEAELDAIEAFVDAGGGLVVLGETEQDKYGSNLNDLLDRFGVRVENATVQDYEHHRGDAPSWVLPDLLPGSHAGSDPLVRVEEVCFYRAGTLALSNGAEPIAMTSASAAGPRRGLRNSRPGAGSDGPGP